MYLRSPRCATIALFMSCWAMTWFTTTKAQSESNVAGNSKTKVIPSLDSRFQVYPNDETPDFQKHVIPLLGKLGCNGRSCHGSFQGRGGFQLSLFGYDFAADHAAMLDESTGRVDLQEIDESLVLALSLIHI